MAQELIIGEFRSIGLEPMAGTDNYRQRFPVTEVTPTVREVTLNGQAVPQENIFAISTTASFAADETGGITVAYIGAGDNPRKRISELSQAKANTLVIVSPAHKKLFDRFRGFLAGKSYRNEPLEPTSIVAVLADSTALEHYSVRVANTVAERTLANIVGVIPGKRAGEMVVFSGHYDHLGIIAPVDGDSIANGADDDASGTTAVLTLARYFKAKGQPERTLVFAAFAAEEIGEFGSEVFSRSIPADSVVAMCNIEMIGMKASWGDSSAWITGYELTTFGPILEEAGKQAGFAFHADPYPDQRLFFRSDNAALARLGVPAHTVSSTQIDTDKYYHSVDDEIETLDIAHVATVIRGIAAGMEPIVSGAKSPTRLTPDALK
jgi:Iap family predicted aminopeptidase